VTDTGKGIEKEFLPYIFGRFMQAASAQSPKLGGLGLGLAIVRQLVEMHGGQVQAESKGIGQGASFTVTLPVCEGKLGYADVFALADFRGLRILCITVEPDALEAFRVLLTKKGAQVEIAQSAGHGYTMFIESHPDAIISNLLMPVENGYDLIRRIREAEKYRHWPHTYAIGITRFAEQFPVESTLRAGFDLQLDKPYPIDRMMAEIALATKRMTRKAA
jgi:CheY-like chemotaxis protein